MFNSCMLWWFKISMVRTNLNVDSTRCGSSIWTPPMMTWLESSLMQISYYSTSLLAILVFIIHIYMKLYNNMNPIYSDSSSSHGKLSNEELLFNFHRIKRKIYINSCSVFLVWNFPLVWFMSMRIRCNILHFYAHHLSRFADSILVSFNGDTNIGNYMTIQSVGRLSCSFSIVPIYKF